MPRAAKKDSVGPYSAPGEAEGVSEGLPREKAGISSKHGAGSGDQAAGLTEEGAAEACEGAGKVGKGGGEDAEAGRGDL